MIKEKQIIQENLQHQHDIIKENEDVVKCLNCKDKGIKTGCIVCGVVQKKEMKTISNKYKFKQPDKKKCKTFWQEEAKQICEEFNITGIWKKMIFQKAKNDMPTLKAKVEYCKENGINNGRYLISMYRK